MADVTNKLKLNERLAGLSDAENLVQKLQQILDLLLEKPDSSELEKKLDEMDKAIEGLKGLRDEQQQVRDDTAKIKNALTAEQKAALEETPEESPRPEEGVRRPPGRNGPRRRPLARRSRRGHQGDRRDEPVAGRGGEVGPVRVRGRDARGAGARSQGRRGAAADGGRG